MVDDPFSRVKAKLRKRNSNDLLDCQLFETAVSQLRGNEWLGDEVLYAYFLLVTRDTSVTVIDPLLIETNANFRLPQYPLTNGSCFAILHLRNRTHWALGVFDLVAHTATIYDSYAYKYNYSNITFSDCEPSVYTLWQKITNLPLEQLIIADSNYTHQQTDGYSCGIFTCLYGERLATGKPTKCENSTPFFLTTARNLIEHRLRNCFVVNDSNVEGADYLPRIYNYLLPSASSYTLVFIQDNGSREVITNVNQSSDDCSLYDRILQISKTDIVPVQRYDISLDELVYYHQVKSCTIPYMFILKTSITESDVSFCRLQTTAALMPITVDRNRILIVFYENHSGFICAALFRHYGDKAKILVLDVNSKKLDARTRSHLRSIAEVYGYNGAIIRALGSSAYKTEHARITAMFVSRFIYISSRSNVNESNTAITTEHLQRHAEDINRTLNFIKLPYTCGNINNAVVQMYLQQYFENDSGVLFVDSLSESKIVLNDYSKCSSSVQTLVILYSDCGVLCGVIIKKKRMRSTGIIYDFTFHPDQKAHSIKFLERIASLYGYNNCQFAHFSEPLFTFTHESEFAIAVCYCLTHTSTLMNSGSLSYMDMQRFIKDVYHKIFSKYSPGDYVDSLIPTVKQIPVVNYEEETLSSKLFSTKVSLHLGPMNVVCRCCSAVSFRGESKSLCCNGGVCLVPDHILSSKKDPALNWLWQRLQSNERLYSMIRAINNLVAFAGLKMNLRKFSTSCGQAPVIVQGSVDVGICHLNPDSKIASFAQLYICDDFKVKNSLKETMQQWKIKVDHKLIEETLSTLKQINVIAISYRSMYEVYVSEMKQFCPLGNEIVPKVIMNLKHKRELSAEISTTTHEGQLNVPKIDNQVAAIYVCSNGILPSHEELDKGLVIMSRGGKTIAAHHNNNIDAMSYPLYFPRGEQSYVRESLPRHASKRTIDEVNGKISSSDKSLCKTFSDDDEETASADTARKFISRAEFYRFVLARRGNLLEHRFYCSGKLLSQFVIHVFNRIEADRLAAIGLNTTEIRSSKASSLYNFLDQRLQEKGLKLGKLVSLPRNFIGSRSWYDQLYHNAMTVAQRVGKPDLFITFTGNQDWPEIRENLAMPFDSWITDPLLCVRVFKLRFQDFINELVHKRIFGEVIALQYSIEYQKRGMPHGHVLITLRDKINTPQKIDEIISAELPQYPRPDDPEKAEKKLLFNLVSRHMVHGPCKNRPKLACRQKNVNKCEKQYPKPFRDKTELSENGYPFYRRRNDNRSVPVGKSKASEARNCDVIPYNAYLLLRYGCHINVECCCSIQAYKYIFKYIYKGADQVLFELLRDQQSVQRVANQKDNQRGVVDLDMRKVYMEARYTSHVEAAYRLCGFPMQHNMHTIIHLNPHLPGEEPVYFKGLPQREIRPASQLLAYFDLVKTNSQAKHMTWVEVAENFRFDGKKYVAYKRSSYRIACLYPVSVKTPERYALRKLLYHIPGVYSFEYLRTVNGILYATFMEAAEAAGYIQRETEWEECLRSACVIDMPIAICRLYATILLHCHPTNPVQLWEKFKEAMRPQKSEDSDDLNDMRSLNYIINILQRNGMSLKDSGLEQVKNVLMNSIGTNVIPNVLPEITIYNDQPTLTTMQQQIIDTILAVAQKPKTTGDKLFFIDGKAGCGKTFTLNALIRSLKNAGRNVLSTASTGIAATLLENGRTAHSLFCLPVKNLHSGACANVDASSALGLELNAVDVIVWDEISMQSRYAFECVDRLLRDVADPAASQCLFGGVTIVLGGDWCQFLPVLQGATKQDTIDITFKSSDLWQFFKTFTLDQNLRLAKEDAEHAAWLLSIGMGTNLCDDDNVVLPQSICMPTEYDIIDCMYTSDVLTNTNALGRMALLTVRNCDAEDLNLKVLQRLPGTFIDLIGIDTPATEEDGTAGLPCDNEEYFHNLMPSSMPPYILRIKIGSIIMLLRNIDVSSQLCNGTRLVVLAILCDNKLLYCTNLTNGEPALVSRMNLDYESERTGIAFRRTQFPVRLSFCMTINKSQGQTFDKVGVILRTPSFTHGSTYVALSRCTTKSGMKVTRNWKDNVPLIPKIRNVVYEEIL